MKKSVLLADVLESELRLRGTAWFQNASLEQMKALPAEVFRILPTQNASAAPAAATPAEEAPKKRRRRKMSAEARKRQSEMMKKRWAERKKAKK